jgi:hypothetical protein
VVDEGAEVEGEEVEAGEEEEEGEEEIKVVEDIRMLRGQEGMIRKCRGWVLCHRRDDSQRIGAITGELE